MADNGNGGVNALAIVAILAIVAGVGMAIWFLFLRGPRSTSNGLDVKVKVDSSAIEASYDPVA